MAIKNNDNDIGNSSNESYKKGLDAIKSLEASKKQANETIWRVSEVQNRCREYLEKAGIKKSKSVLTIE